MYFTLQSVFSLTIQIWYINRQTPNTYPKSEGWKVIGLTDKTSYSPLCRGCEEEEQTAKHFLCALFFIEYNNWEKGWRHRIFKMIHVPI